MIRKKIIVSTLIIILAISGFAQKNTNSPYTRFGYGNIVDGTFGRANAMGGIGLGFRQNNTINTINPASYSAIDSTSFLFEVGLSSLISSFNTNNTHISKIAGNIDYIALQFPVTKWLGVSAGVLPYSFVGYEFKTKDSTYIISSNDSIKHYNFQGFNGKGGISQVFLGLSFKIFDRLSVGVNGYYMFGAINHIRKSEQVFSDGRPSYYTLANSELRTNSFNTRFGVQYCQPLRDKKDILTIGAIYEFKHKLGSTYFNTIESIDTIVDTLQNVFEIPNTYGLGVTYLYDNRILIGLDGQYQQFSKAKFEDHTGLLKDRLKISAGAEYIHNPGGAKYIHRMRWRIGGNYSASYINVNNRNINSYAITAGIGFPFRTIKSILNLNLEYGGFGSTNHNLIKENYLRIGLNFTINENWFRKAKIQ